jgi:hypothetical protein
MIPSWMLSLGLACLLGVGAATGPGPAPKMSGPRLVLDRLHHASGIRLQAWFVPEIRAVRIAVECVGARCPEYVWAPEVTGLVVATSRERMVFDLAATPEPIVPIVSLVGIGELQIDVLGRRAAHPEEPIRSLFGTGFVRTS